MELAAGPELGSLLPKADVVYKLPSSVKRDIKFLQEELEILQVALSDIAEVPAEELDDHTKARAAELRDLSVQIQDVTDPFGARIRTHRLRMAEPWGLNGFAARINFKLASLRARQEFANSIKELKRRLQDADERHERYRMHRSYSIHVAARRHALTEIDGPQLLPDTEGLVGIDGHRHELVKILTEEGATSSQQLKVVAVVGDGPVGKTTLAKVVYDNIAPQQFDLKAWVTVSSRPDILKILTGMLRQISSEDVEDYIRKLDPKQLLDKIRRTLQDKRYLIVIDNILDEPEWEVLKCALIDNNHGSVALLTSRKADHIAHFVGKLYILPHLSEIDSKKLFYMRVFGSEHQCPPELAEISEEFIKKIDGMPSTIISIARFLASKTSMKKDEWTAVYASIFSGLLFDQIIGHGLERSKHFLPAHLKPCLLYFCMFQKGCEVSAEHLVWQWIEEGFIGETDSEGRSLQELGEDYLNELINRKLIELVDVDARGRALSCSVNGMVHDWIMSMSTGEKFVTVLGGQQGKSLSNIVNRLSIQSNNIEQPLLDEGSLSQVKSLVVSGDTNLMPSLSLLQDLRVLDLGGCHSMQNDDIRDIGNLFHLKCLIIGGKCITFLPEKIGNLIFLETLDLRESGVIELPESIFQTKQLKRLYVNSATKIPQGIGRLEALQELGDIQISEPSLLKELHNLTKLRILRIAIWSWEDEKLKVDHQGLLVENLCSLVQVRQNIQSLTILTCCSMDFMDKMASKCAPPSLKNLEIRYGTFERLPRWIDSLHLSSLSIEVNELSQDMINMLGKLDTLCSLSLTSKHHPQGKFGMDTDGFKNLASLEFVSNVMMKTFEPLPAMQKLKRLKLRFQASLTKDVNHDFSFGLEELSLDHIHVQIICFNASYQVLREAETAIQQAISCRNPRPNLEIRRVREEDMTESDEEVVPCNAEENPHNETTKKRSSRKVRVTTKRFRRKDKGVARKYKIISLQLESQILTLRAL